MPKNETNKYPIDLDAQQMTAGNILIYLNWGKDPNMNTRYIFGQFIQLFQYSNISAHCGRLQLDGLCLG